ncbi:MAG: prepilin-type N-terminal cleavage/methylation domain-containing protein [Polyangiales bacterium]
MKRARRHPQRGYTLVELLISMLITAVTVVALYQVSRSATDTFNQQQRAAEMQLRLRFAMETLRADVARAGFMMTPNSATDPRVCPRPMIPLQAIEVSRDSTPAIPLPTDNGFVRPARLRMVGNYASLDEYRVAGINGSTITLQNQTPQWAQIDSAPEMTRIFIGPVGGRRLLRITSNTGSVQFVQVTGVAWQPSSGTALPTLTVSPAPVLIGEGMGMGTQCGVSGLDVGATVSPLLMVEYGIDSLFNDPTQRIRHRETYPADDTVAALKTDLVRREFNIQPDIVENVGAARVVGEYGVDLDVGLALDDGTPVGSLTGPPAMRTLGIGDPAIETLAGNVNALGATTAFPQRVRALIVRLSVRDRDQDPSFGWVARTAATEPLTRLRVFNDRPGAARVRTLTTEVALPNLALRNLR